MRMKDNKIIKLILNHLLEVIKKYIFKSIPKSQILFRLRLEKYVLQKKCWLNSAFLFILYLWIRIRIHGSKLMRIRIHITDYPCRLKNVFVHSDFKKKSIKSQNKEINTLWVISWKVQFLQTMPPVQYKLYLILISSKLGKMGVKYRFT